MATTADSSSNNHSTISDGGESMNSPQFQRKNLPSRWAQVVRGESESIPAVHHSPPPLSSSSLPSSSLAGSVAEQAHFSDCSPAAPPDNSVADESSDVNNSNAARPKKLAWNKPSNGVVDVGPVMDAVSWPALSESTKASPKSSSADSSTKAVTDGSVSTSQVPVIPHSPKKQANANPNSTTNHSLPARQRSMKRGGGGGGGGGNTGGGPPQSGFTHPPPPPPPPPPFPIFPMAPNNFTNLVPVVPDPSPREFSYRSSNWESRPIGGFVSQSHVGNDHRNSSRRGNFGSHQRGDGHYHNSYGGRRDNARDVHLQSPRAPPRGYVRQPSPNTAAFVNPQPMRPFVNHMNYPDFYYIPALPMEPIRPFIPHAPPPPMFIPVAEPSLLTLLLNQIDYYFSDANLVKDDYLRSNMDDQGWVPITLIANFPRVKNLTSSIQLILESLRTSTLVEVQDDKLRRRNDWARWMPTSARLSSNSGSISPSESSYDILATSLRNITVEELDANQSRMTGAADPNSDDVPVRSSTESIGQSQLPNGEITQNSYSNWN